MIDTLQCCRNCKQNRNGFGEGNDTNQGRHVFFILLIFGGLFTRTDHLTHHNIFIFMTVTNNIYQKQIKYHVFNAVTNSELTELVPVFTTWPAFPTSIKKVNTSFKNVWRTWGPALPTLLADLMIFCPLGLIGPTNFKLWYCISITKKSDMSITVIYHGMSLTVLYQYH